MGPRLNSRGRKEKAIALTVRYLLQWGRGWAAAEGSGSAVAAVDP